MSELAAALGRALGDGYVIERELTAGGMSRVFVAFDRALNRRVAVKVLSREILAHLSSERFLREVQTLATLQHPNIVSVISAGAVEGVPYFVMPYIEGESLRRVLRRDGALPVRDAVRLLRDVARALAFAHERGIVHRDIKPDNVLLADGAAIVSDFGVAKAVDAAQRSAPTTNADDEESAHALTGLTAAGSSVGTPAYMSPEQVAADPTIDHRADIYSFGVLAYELLVGGHPFDSQTPQAVLVAHLTQTPPPIQHRRRDVPPVLGKLVMQCLEKDRDKRPQSARAVLDQLDAPFESGNSFSALLARAPVRHRARWLSAVTVALFAVVAGGWWWWRGTAGPSTSSVAGANAETLLVMPFSNVGGDSSSAYIADGMSSELIGALARVRGLRVILHTPSGSEQRRYGTEDALARALHATAVLAGTVRHHAPQVRVSARLVSVATGAALWASTFDRTFEDVFNVQDDIVRAIAGAMGGRDAPGTAVATAVATVPATRGTNNAEAFDLFLRARYQFQRRGADALRRAMTLATQAIAQDSRFARAYALRAQVAAVLPLYADAGTAADSLLASGVADATRAVQLDSTLSEAYAARATLLHGSFSWPQAERDYRHAVALTPDDPAIHQWLGEHLLVRGRVPEGVSELREAARLDPLSPVIQASFALATAIGGNRSEGLRVARRAIDLDSTLFVTRLMLGSILLFDHQDADALVQLKEADHLAPDRPTVQGMLGIALVRSGRAVEARALMQHLSSVNNPDAVLAVGHIALALGDTTRALDALERAVRERAPQLTAESLWEPIFDELRTSARFVALQKALDAASAR